MRRRRHPIVTDFIFDFVLEIFGAVIDTILEAID